MKLIAVVVTYYPNISETIINIKKYIEDVDLLIIWENTPLKDRNSYKISISEYQDKIIYKGTDDNEGIAYALNRCVEWAIKNNYTHILTMDQDSCFVDFSSYKSEINKNLYRKEIAVFSPNVNNERSETNNIELELDSITSGSVYDLDIFAKVGMFREDYFIDAVDTEFCIRVREYGLQIVTLCRCHLVQEFGNITKSVLGFKTANYSAFRTYFIIRNHIWVWREYGNKIPQRMKHFLIWESILKRMFTILLHESNKFAKYRSIRKGITDGLRKNI